MLLLTYRPSLGMDESTGGQAYDGARLEKVKPSVWRGGSSHWETLGSLRELADHEVMWFSVFAIQRGKPMST